MLRWLRYLRESQARHAVTSSVISCALTDTTLTVTDLTHLQLTPRLMLPVFFFLAARHPADIIDSVSYRWCPGTDHVIFADMVSVPLKASTALQSAVLASVLFLSKSGGHRHVEVFHLTVSSFDWRVVVLSTFKISLMSQTESSVSLALKYS